MHRTRCGRDRFSSMLALIMILSFGSSKDSARAQRGAIPRQHVGGTGVSLTPPAGFVPAMRFPGFELDSKDASIMVMEIPGPFEKVTAGFDSAGLASRGISLVNSRPVRIAGMSGGLLLFGRQEARGVAYSKWMAAFGDSRLTVLVMGTFPRAHEAELSDAMRAAVLSATWDRGARRQPGEGLRFSLNPRPPLRLARQLANMLVFTEGGAFPAGNPRTMVLVAGWSFHADVRPANRKSFARTRIQQSAGMRDVSLVAERSIMNGGLSGIEATATAVDRKTGAPMFVYQSILFDRYAYFIMQGQAGADRRTAALAAFRSAASTFRKSGL